MVHLWLVGQVTGSRSLPGLLLPELQHVLAESLSVAARLPFTVVWVVGLDFLPMFFRRTVNYDNIIAGSKLSVADDHTQSKCTGSGERYLRGGGSG